MAGNKQIQTHERNDGHLKSGRQTRKQRVKYIDKNDRDKNSIHTQHKHDTGGARENTYTNTYAN